MPFDDEFADFLTSEIEKHVRAGMKSVLDKVESMIKDIPAPEKGISLDDVKQIVADAVGEIEIPAPKEPDISHLEKMVQDAIDAIPEVKDGQDGRDGVDGKDGQDGADGKDGVSPSPESVAAAMEGEFAKWALGFERKADDVLQKAVDRLPKPKDGIDGKNALELEDFDLTLGEDGRTVTMSLKRGEEVVSKSVKLPMPDYKGFWKDGVFEKGDMVTYAGSLWIAAKETSEKPEYKDSDWSVIAKKGGTGKSAFDIAKEAGFVGTHTEWLDSLGKKPKIKVGE